MLTRCSLLLAAALAAVPLSAQTANPPPAAAEDEVVRLSVFEVNAAQDEGYKATNVVSGTRVNEAIRDLPLNISVVTEDLLNDLKSTTLMNALEYTAGVNFEDERNMSFQVRGYRVWIPRRNGSRTNHPYVQTANVERVEFIRGPASVLYGEADPGGIINTLTKRPKPRPRTTLAVTAGSWDFYRADLDVNRPLNASRSLLGRVNLSYRTNETWVDFEQNETTMVAPSLLWKPTEKTQVFVDYEYLNVHRNLGGFIPRFSDPASTSPYASQWVNYWDPVSKSYVARPLGTSYPNNRFFNYRWATDDPSFSLNGPLSFGDAETHLGLVEVSHQFNDELSVRLSWTYGDRVDSEYRFGGAGVRNEGGYFQGTSTVPAQAYRTNGRTIGIMGDTDIRGYTAQADVAWVKQLGKVENKFIAYVEQGINRQTQWAYNAGSLPVAERLPNPANITLQPGVDPGYNDPAWSPQKFTLRSDSKGRTRAVSVSDQIALLEKRWRILAGVRWQETGITNVQRRWTPQYGTTFRLTPEITLYGLLSEAFTQQFQRKPEDGEWAEPVLGKGREAGIKFDLLQGKVSGMVAWFKTERINQWSTVPLDPPNPAQVNPDRQSVYRDEESQGIEIDLLLTPVRNWQIIAGYAFTDSAVTANPAERDVNAINWPSVVGWPLANTPLHRFNVWNRYNFQSGRLKGFYVGGGVVYAGDRAAQVDGRTLFLTLPAYTRLDVLLGYRHRVGKTDIDYSVKVENLLDEVYLRSQQAFGSPRDIKFTVRTSF